MSSSSIRTPALADSMFVVLGGSGAVGRYLLRRLAAANLPAIALSRNAPPQWAQNWPSVVWHQGGLPHTRLSDLPEASVLLSAGPLDALAAACENGLPKSVRRVVALSSMSIDWKRDSPNPAERDLASHLLNSEKQARDALDRLGVELCILRPGMIYGAGVDRSLSPLQRFAQRWHFLPWPMGGTGLRCPVHADDIAAALHQAAIATDVPAAPLRLVGAESLPFGLLLDRLFGALNIRAVRVPVAVPMGVFRALAGGGGPMAGVAAMLFRSAQDQNLDTKDWIALNLVPRGFLPNPEDFRPWGLDCS